MCSNREMTEIKYMRIITKGLGGIENYTMNNTGTVLCEKLEFNNENQTFENVDQNRYLTSYTETKFFFFLDFLLVI